MMAAMILRNVRRHLPRLRPMILALATAVAVLLLGNSISDAINTGYREVYTENITGEVTISAASERSFTVFGSEALLMGEFLVPPVLVAYDDLVEKALSQAGDEVTGQTTSLACAIAHVGDFDRRPQVRRAPFRIVAV
jgi:hypothetical protein